MIRLVVSGNSMEPAYSAGDKLLACRYIYKLRKPRVGEVVALKDPRTNRQILKRINKIEGDKCFVAGDNPSKSTDSREFGPISRSVIIGKVFFKYGSSIDNKDL